MTNIGHLSSGGTVTITSKSSYEYLREIQHSIETKKIVITCGWDECNGALHMKALDSGEVTTHFAHNPNSGNPFCPNRQGEKPEHKMAKESIIAMLKGKGVRFSEFEKYLKGDDKKTRRADVYIVYENGVTEVHEVQFSGQSSTVTERRTKDYYDHGVDNVVWWWGSPARYNGNFVGGNWLWCIENLAMTGLMDVEWGEDDSPLRVNFTETDCATVREEMKLAREQARISRISASTRFAHGELKSRISNNESRTFYQQTTTRPIPSPKIKDWWGMDEGERMREQSKIDRLTRENKKK